MKYIKDREELRKVEFPTFLKDVIDCGGKGYFHYWFQYENTHYAMVESEDGTMRKIPTGNIQFVEYFEGERRISL
jgi:hypothetical protein